MYLPDIEIRGGRAKVLKGICATNYKKALFFLQNIKLLATQKANAQKPRIISARYGDLCASKGTSILDFT